MASIGQATATASELASGADLSALLVGARIFQDKFPLATLTHYSAFMTTYELCKGVPESGVELKQLHVYLATGRNRDEPMPKSTFSRIMRTLSVNEGAFSYTTREKGFGLIEIFQLDKRSKAVRITDAGHELVSEMTDPHSIDFERGYFDSMIDTVADDNEYQQSEEYKEMKRLFNSGLHWSDVEKRFEQWKDANPDKLFTRRGQQTLEMPVPEGVTDKWLEKYNNTSSDEERKIMLEQAGLFVDDTMQNMMFLAEPTKRKGIVKFNVHRDLTRNKELSKRLLKFVERTRDMERLKEAGWNQMSEHWINSKQPQGELKMPILTRMRTDEVMMGQHSSSRRDIQEHEEAKNKRIESLEAQVADLTALMKQMLESKANGS